MKWLKLTVVDLAVTLLLLVAALQNLPALEIPLLLYTGLVLLLKIFAFSNTGVLQRINKASLRAPDWFYHLLYMVNSAASLVGRRWTLGALWLAIWLLSWLTARKLRSLPQSSSRKTKRA